MSDVDTVSEINFDFDPIPQTQQQQQQSSQNNNKRKRYESDDDEKDHFFDLNVILFPSEDYAENEQKKLDATVHIDQIIKDLSKLRTNANLACCHMMLDKYRDDLESSLKTFRDIVKIKDELIQPCPPTIDRFKLLVEQRANSKLEVYKECYSKMYPKKFYQSQEL